MEIVVPHGGDDLGNTGNFRCHAHFSGMWATRSHTDKLLSDTTGKQTCSHGFILLTLIID